MFFFCCSCMKCDVLVATDCFGQFTVLLLEYLAVVLFTLSKGTCKVLKNELYLRHFFEIAFKKCKKFNIFSFYYMVLYFTVKLVPGRFFFAQHAAFHPPMMSCVCLIYYETAVSLGLFLSIYFFFFSVFFSEVSHIVLLVSRICFQHCLSTWEGTGHCCNLFSLLNDSFVLISPQIISFLWARAGFFFFFLIFGPTVDGNVFCYQVGQLVLMSL